MWRRAPNINCVTSSLQSELELSTLTSLSSSLAPYHSIRFHTMHRLYHPMDCAPIMLVFCRVILFRRKAWFLRSFQHPTQVEFALTPSAPHCACRNSPLWRSSIFPRIPCVLDTKPTLWETNSRLTTLWQTARILYIEQYVYKMY